MEHSGTCEGYDDTAAVAEVEMVAMVHPRLLVVESHLSSPRFFWCPCPWWSRELVRCIPTSGTTDSYFVKAHPRSALLSLRGTDKVWFELRDGKTMNIFGNFLRRESSSELRLEAVL